MELSSVFNKTRKGVEEISTRAHRLPSRVRAMLILVDGHRNGHELLALSHSAEEGRRQLATLLAGGFVEIVPGHLEGPAPAIAEEPPDLPDEDISLARSYAVHTLWELLGVHAGGLVADIEKARTSQDLRQHVGRIRAALRHAPDQHKVRQFIEKLTLALD